MGLTREGLERLWAHIVSLVSGKVDAVALKHIADGTASGSVRTSNSAKESDNYSLGEGAFAQGLNTKASGGNAHAEGSYTYATSHCSHAEGNGYSMNFPCTITGEAYAITYTVTEPYLESLWVAKRHIFLASDSADNAVMITAVKTNDAGELTITVEKTLSATALTDAAVRIIGTVASNSGAHAEGDMTCASGSGSHAENVSTIASGRGSHAEGWWARASGEFQHVQGKYNVEDADGTYAHIVGNGAGSNAHSNAHTLDWNGNAWYAGDIYVGSTSGTNKDEGSKRIAPAIRQRIVIASSWSANSPVSWKKSQFGMTSGTTDTHIIVGPNGSNTAEQMEELAAAKLLVQETEDSLSFTVTGTVPTLSPEIVVTEVF